MFIKNLLKETSYFGEGIIGGKSRGGFKTDMGTRNIRPLSGGSETSLSYEQKKVKKAIKTVKCHLKNTQALDLDGYSIDKKKTTMGYQMHTLESPYFFLSFCEIMEEHELSAQETCMYFLTKLTSYWINDDSFIINDRCSGFAEIFEMLLETLSNEVDDGGKKIEYEPFIYAVSKINSKIIQDCSSGTCSGVIIESDSNDAFMSTLINGINVPCVGIRECGLRRRLQTGHSLSIDGNSGRIKIHL